MARMASVMPSAWFSRMMSLLAWLWMKPGTSVLTRMPAGPSSRARQRVMVATAPLLTT
jgi:hypothetical protein